MKIVENPSENMKNTMKVKVERAGREMILTCKAENGKVYLNGTSQYYDLIDNDIIATLKSHQHPDTKITIVD